MKKIGEVNAEWQGSNRRTERRPLQEKSLTRMHTDGRVMHTEETEEGRRELSEGCRVAVAERKGQ